MCVGVCVCRFYVYRYVHTFVCALVGTDMYLCIVYADDYFIFTEIVSV